MSAVARWTRRRAAPAKVPTHDLLLTPFCHRTCFLHILFFFDNDLYETLIEPCLRAWEGVRPTHVRSPSLAGNPTRRLLTSRI